MTPRLPLLLVSLLASTVVAIYGPDQGEKCLAVGTVCDSMLGPAGTCCEDTYCPPPILDVAYCTPFDQGGEDTCLADGVVCDSMSGPAGTCCKGSYCPPPILDVAYCTPSKPDQSDKCLAVGAVCDSMQGPAGTCCDDSYCPPPILDVAYCTPKEQGQGDVCLKDGAVCDSMLGPAGTCCEGSYCPPPILDVAYCTSESKGHDKRSCGRSGAGCGERFGNLPCCSGNICDTSVNEGTCVDKSRRCVPEEGICATEIGPVGFCCKDMHCQPDGAGSFSRCKRNLPCLYEGDTCVGIDGQRGSCCGQTQCVFKSPDLSVCEKVETCKPEGSSCQRVLGECCDGFACSMLGGAGRGICRPFNNDLDTNPEPENCLYGGSTCAEVEGPEGGCCPPFTCHNLGGISKCL